jgi:hypothetical protein
VCNSWVAEALTYKPIDRTLAEEGINWMYEMAGLARPIVIYEISPMAAQRKANVLANPKKDLVYYSFCYYGSIWSAAFLSYYDFFEKIGVKNMEKLEPLKKILRSGVYDQIQFDTTCIACERPVTICRDNDHNLHSEKTAAISWRDGWEIYFLSGVRFEKDLWDKITQKKISAKEILKLKNIAQRMAGLKCYGIENLIHDTGAVAMDISPRGNFLYKIDGVFHQTEYFLRYTCPSTGRVYMKATQPNEINKWIAEKKNRLADRAMAIRHNMTLDQYDNCQES